MSEIRKINIEIDDLGLLKTIAENLGYTFRYDYLNVFGHREEADIVFKKGNVKIGFKRVENGIQQIFDSLHKEEATELINKYKEESILSRLRKRGWRIKERIENKDQIILQVVKWSASFVIEMSQYQSSNTLDKVNIDVIDPLVDQVGKDG